MRAQGCCEGFCDDQNIAGRNNPDVRSDLSKQEARKRPERALLGITCVHALPDIVESLHSRPETSSVHCQAISLIRTILRLTLWSVWFLNECFYGIQLYG